MTTDLQALADRIRASVITQSHRAHVGHIGSALCIAELLAVLFGDILRLDGEDRDRLVLSKGHAALALYAALEATGQLSASELDTFSADGTPLGAHPEHTVKGIDFSTGSLGHGLSLGAGAALGARLQESPRRAYVVLSDAELDEGSVWEAAMFAAHHRLDNLVAIVDMNGQQALGYTRDVLNLEPMADRWRAFGWTTVDTDGHDTAGLRRAMLTESSGPTVVLARTTFGKGVSFMENRIEWHYLPLSDDAYRQALRELPQREDGREMPTVGRPT